MKEQPKAYSYIDYRKFLDDMCNFLKDEGLYRVSDFAKRARLGSASYMRMIIKGQRNLTEATARRIAKAFGLSQRESEFFQLLVAFSNAEDSEEQTQTYEKILRHREFQKRNKKLVSQYEYFSNWRSIAFLQALATDWRKLSRAKQAHSLGIKVPQLLKLAKDMESCDLIRKDDQDRWVRKDEHIETVLETRSLQIRKLHQTMTQKSMESLASDPKEIRTHLSLSLLLSEDKIPQLRKKMFEILSELVTTSESKNADCVYQVNLQSFPLLRLK